MLSIIVSAGLLCGALAAHTFPSLPPLPIPTAPAAAKSTGSGNTLMQGLQTAIAGQSTEDEIATGNGIAASILGSVKLWNNPSVQQYVNLVGRNLARNSERKDVPWRFAVIDTPSINAFAFPGGVIFVTRGLYDILETEDELAGVLAHEVSHVTRQHQWEVIKQQKLVAMGASAAMQGKNDIIQQKMVEFGTTLISRGLDKGAEYEADRDAMVIAARSGYDPAGLVGVMARLASLKGEDKNLGLLFKSHPSPSARIDNMSLAAESSRDLMRLVGNRSPESDRIARYR